MRKGPRNASAPRRRETPSEEGASHLVGSSRQVSNSNDCGCGLGPVPCEPEGLNVGACRASSAEQEVFCDPTTIKGRCASSLTKICRLHRALCTAAAFEP